MGAEHRGAQATACGLWPRWEALCFLRGPDAWLGSGGHQGSGAGAGKRRHAHQASQHDPIHTHHASVPTGCPHAPRVHVQGAAGGGEHI